MQSVFNSFTFSKWDTIHNSFWNRSAESHSVRKYYTLYQENTYCVYLITITQQLLYNALLHVLCLLRMAKCVYESNGSYWQVAKQRNWYVLRYLLRYFHKDEEKGENCSRWSIQHASFNTFLNHHQIQSSEIRLFQKNIWELA